MNDERLLQVLQTQVREDARGSTIRHAENLDWASLSLLFGDSTTDASSNPHATSHSPLVGDADISTNLGRADVDIIDTNCTERGDENDTTFKSTDPTSTITSSCSQAPPSSRSIDTSKYPSSCIVKLSAGESPGDLLTIRWPTIEQNEYATEVGTEKASKRLRFDDSSGNAESDLLVTVTLPGSIKSRKNKTRHIKVFAPWIAANHAAVNTLTARQLRSIGIDDHANCNIDLRRSRQQHVRNHGEGQFYERQTRIGDRYQVSAPNIPSSDTFANDRLSNDESASEKAAATYDQIWDTALSEEANLQGEPLHQYIDSLCSFQKAQGMMELHQSAYKVSTEGSFLPSSNSTEASSAQICQSSQIMLEGKPFTPKEKETFHVALGEYRKQWHKVAQAVGTSVNRCLIYYYSTFKTGNERDAYLANKKIWEQSDECEICHDGGDLICCDGCINSYHMTCISPTMNEVPTGVWLCPICENLKAHGNSDL